MNAGRRGRFATAFLFGLAASHADGAAALIGRLTCGCSRRRPASSCCRMRGLRARVAAAEPRFRYADTPRSAMKTAARKFLLVVFISVIASCASRPAPPTGKHVAPIRSIAIVTGDPLASAIGIELFNQGFRTFEVPATQDLTPKALQSLAIGGVDGVLVVRSTRRGFDSLPGSASLRLVSTHTGETVAAFTWSNSVPAAPSSPADRVVRKSLTDVARELIQTLLKTVPKPPAA